MFKLKKKNLALTAGLVLLLLFISFSIPAIRTPLLNTLEQPANLLTLASREVRGLIFYHRNLIQNEKLQKQIDLLRLKINSLNETQLENLRLKKALSLKQKTPFRVVVARVVGRSADSWSSVIVADKGTYNGIRRGMPVITYLGLLGRVVETTEFTSKIMLISDPNLNVSCLIQRSRQEGLVSGTLGGQLIMKYLPEEADIKIHDIVVTSGLNETYPKGLIIGLVVDIGKEFSGLSRYCVIKPAVNLSTVEEVLIITSLEHR